MLTIDQCINLIYHWSVGQSNMLTIDQCINLIYHWSVGQSNMSTIDQCVNLMSTIDQCVNLMSTIDQCVNLICQPLINVSIYNYINRWSLCQWLNQWTIYLMQRVEALPHKPDSLPSCDGERLVTLDTPRDCVNHRWQVLFFLRDSIMGHRDSESHSILTVTRDWADKMVLANW